MADLPAIYLRLISARIRAQLQYRLSFLLDVLGSFFLTIIDFLAIIVIFYHLPALAGWTLEEVAFLYGTSYVIFKLVDMLIGHLDGLGDQVQAGQFDMIMVRPLGALFQVVTLDFGMRQLGAVLQGLIIFGLALWRVDIDWNTGRVLLLAQMPFSGALIFASVWVAGHTIIFWITRGREAINAFTYGGNMFTTYPIQIYGAWLRRLLAFVIPLAFVNYLPALYILDKPNPLGVPDALRFASPLVAVIAALVAWRLWNFGVRHYRSTGS